jgi:hypothetical protein
VADGTSVVRLNEVLSDSPQAIEHGSSRTGLWLRARRFRIAIWIAVLETLVVLVSHDVTKVTVIVLALLAVVTFVITRNARSHTVRQLAWIFAASQLLALIPAILGFIVKGLVIAALVIFALLGLAYLFLDRR